MQTKTREDSLEGFLKAGLASLEMRHERGFSLEVPLVWVEEVHRVIYGEQVGATVCEARIDAARNRLARRQKPTVESEQ